MYTRYFINQPATSQAGHRYHGLIVAARNADMRNQDKTVVVIPLDATSPTICMQIPKLWLSTWAK